MAGIDHVFVSRLVGGSFQAPEQVDAGLAGAGSQPVVAASDGGRLVVAFVSGGGLFSAVRPAGAPGYAAIQQIADAGANPDVEMSINGVAYLTWSTGGDVLAARMERNATTFNGVPGPLDIDPAAIAGTGTGRPKVAVAADGVATVVWGEGGHAYARRIFELRLSAAPQDLGEGADEPDISSEDDSSFAWAVFRQGGQAIARRLVGSQFDPPVPIEGGEARRRAARRHQRPRRRLRGRRRRRDARRAYGAVLKDDLFNPGALIGGGLRRGAGARAGGGRERRRPHRLPAGRRRRRAHGARAPLRLRAGVAGRHAAGARRDALRPRAGADRRRARARGRGRPRRRRRRGLRPGRRRRAPDRRRQPTTARPGTFRASTTTKWRKFARPPLKWGTAFELWGPLTYRVLIDGKPVGHDDVDRPHGADRGAPTACTAGAWSPPTSAARRAATPSRNLRVDATPPKVTFKVSGSRKRGKQVKVAVQATDAQRHGREGVGAEPRAHLLRRRLDGRHRAARRSTATGTRGKVTVRVSASDKAGNAIAVHAPDHDPQVAAPADDRKRRSVRTTVRRADHAARRAA